MPELSLKDVTLHYEIEGDGPPLLLLAGMMGDSASWGALAPLLTPHFTVIRPDNRTTGRTIPWNAPVSVHRMAQDAQALMQHLRHSSYHVAGHSMGGLMAMELAGLAGGALASLSILASAPVRVPRTAAVFDTLLKIRQSAAGEELWLRALYPWIFQPDFFNDAKNTENALKAALGYPHAQTADAMAHQIEALRSFRPTVRPADLACPTQTLFAEHDLLIPEPAGRTVFEAVPDITQHSVAGAGHSLHWDAPQAVADHLRSFIAQHPIAEST